MNAQGFTTKDVHDAPPDGSGAADDAYTLYYFTGSRAASGSRYGSGETYGGVAADDYFVATHDITEEETATYQLNAGTLNASWFSWSGEEQTLPGSAYFTAPVIQTVHTGLNTTNNGYNLPVVANSLTSETVTRLHSNGRSWEVLRYDPAVTGLFFPWMNYYHYPGVNSALCLYTAVEYGIVSGDGEVLRIGVIKNGVRTEVQFNINGAGLVEFPGTARYTYGDVRIVVALPRDNEVRR